MNTNAPPPKTAREWVGRNVREQRRALGLTLEQVSERLSARGFLLDRSQLSKIENGRTNVDVEKLLALADALDVVPDRLLRDPEHLDRELFRRLLEHWRSAAVESARYGARAELLLEELRILAGRLQRDDVTGMTAVEVVDDESFELEHFRWVPAIPRVGPESPGYASYVETLASGRGDMVFESPFPPLTPWEPKTSRKTGSK